MLYGLCDGVFRRFFLDILAKEKMAFEKRWLLLSKEIYFRKIKLLQTAVQTLSHVS